jgi:hypothetical protein
MDQLSNNKEQELLNIRERIARRHEAEKNLDQTKLETETARDVLKEYQSEKPENVISKEMAVPVQKVEGMVLRLRPESHDAKMEELLGVLLDKGIKNALSVVEKLKDPHLEDDFHRFLVQYLFSNGGVAGLKEGSALEQSLGMILAEITIPESLEEDQKNFKALIASMEQFYAGMQSIGDGSDNKGKRHFTIEVALSAGSDEVVVYASVPRDKFTLLEKQVLSVEPSAKIKEVTDDYNIFSVGGASSGAYIKFKKHESFPIKTYDAFEYDPINLIMKSFSKLDRDTEGAAIQMVIRPEGQQAVKRMMKSLNYIKEGMSVDSAYREAGKSGAIKFLEDTVKTFSSEEKKEKKVKTEHEIAIANITEKTKSSILSAEIRVIASAKTKERADDIVHELESSFNQFDNPTSNSFEFVPVKDRALPEFLRDYSFRNIRDGELLPMNLRELSTVFHFPSSISDPGQLRQSKAGTSPAPVDMSEGGILLGYNDHQGKRTPVHFGREDRMRHFYVIGQTGTGKTSLLKTMIKQDMENGDGVCFIDPHGNDIQDILSYVPPERYEDVIYFDPSYTPRPMGLNMLEYDVNHPEQKSIVIDALFGIFNQLFDMKATGGPQFEQYFTYSADLVMSHPESGNTLLEITRVLADKTFRDLKLSHCKDPRVKQFWASAEATKGEAGLENFVPYITSKFDRFISNEFLRPIVLQETSVLNFREIMDKKKILLVNLSKGLLGEIGSSFIGMIIVGKLQMAALSRADSYGQKLPDFYLYIDEFQNVTTPAIASILSEARKYRLSLNVAHQFIGQLTEEIKNAVFGNIGSMAIHRVSPEDSKFLESKFLPTFSAQDITRLDNFNSYVSMIVNGAPTVRPFNIIFPGFPDGNKEQVEKLKELSYLKYGRERAEVEQEIFDRFKKANKME